MQIRKLPQRVIDQIAAGEVITRPVNIVKELVENAIDAGATRVSINIQDGGIGRIVVKDNGAGIPADQLALAFELHSSSKIDDDNIYNVSTLGFRGEALASITAVTRVKCKSRPRKQENGRQIIIEGSEVKKETDVTMRNPGTEIEVVGLFYNIPARRKFLKSTSVEKKAIVDLIRHIALTYHNLHIELTETKGGKIVTLVQSPAREEQLSAVYDILGEKVAKNLVRVEGDAGRWKVSGYVSAPILTKKDRSMQFIRVNGRAVRQNDIQKAVEESYGAQLLKRTYPVIILDIKGENHWVDYNVHPQKTEIRFASDDPILEELSILVKKTLSKGAEVPTFQGTRSFEAKFDHNTTKPSYTATTTSSVESEGEIQSAKFDSRQMSLEEFHGNRQSRTTHGHKVLGQIMKKFALIDAGDELWLMDIHASDERVKFEKYESHADSMIMSQQLLNPLPIEVGSEIIDLVRNNREEFSKFGMDVSTVKNRVLIHSIPTYFDQKLSSESITSFFEDILLSVKDSEEANVVNTPLSELQYYIVSRLACHGSIRSGYFVGNETISKVLDDLLKCSNPWTCAHGRPTILRFSHNTLEGWFRRSG